MRNRLLRIPPGGKLRKKPRESMEKTEIASREEVLAMLTEKARKGHDRARVGATSGRAKGTRRARQRARSHPDQVRPRLHLESPREGQTLRERSSPTPKDSAAAISRTAAMMPTMVPIALSSKTLKQGSGFPGFRRRRQRLLERADLDLATAANCPAFVRSRHWRQVDAVATERGPSRGDADARSVVQWSSSTSPMMMPSGPRT